MARASGVEPEPLSLRRTLASGTAWSATGRAAVLAFGLLGQALTARLLAPADFGVYNLLLSVAGLVALVSQFGLPQTAVRHIAGANASQSAGGTRAALTTSVTLAALLALAAGLLTLWPLGPLLDPVFPDARVRAVTGFLAVLVAVRILENVAPELFRGVRDFRGGSIFGGSLQAVLLAGLSAAVLVATPTAPLATVLWISVASSGVSLLLAALLLWRRMRRLPAATGARWMDLSVLSPAIWLATSINYAITQLDLWVVGALGAADDVALYSAAFRLSTLVMMPLIVVNFVVAPLVVELLARDQRQRLQLAVQTVATVAGVPALVALAVFAAFGSWVCAFVYGGFYAAAGTPLMLLTIGKIASVLAGSCGITLIMSGGQRTSVRILALSIAVTLPLQVLGFRLASLDGLALATSVGFATQNLLLVIAVRRRLGIRTEVNVPQTIRLLRGDSVRGMLRGLQDPRRGGVG